MRKQKISVQEREKIFDSIDRQNALYRRRQRLYNRRYRKTPVYLTATVLRILSLLFFVCVIIFNQKSSGFRSEIVESRDSSSYQPRRNSAVGRLITVLNIGTSQGHYRSRFKDDDTPFFKVGDTLRIERNIFNKPIYFSKQNWDYAYAIELNGEWYGVCVLLVVISLFFNDGLDRATDKIIWVAWTINLIALYCYFFT